MESGVSNTLDKKSERGRLWVITMNPVDFGKRFKRARKAAKKTQQEIADACGLSNRTVSAWESGVAEGIIADNLFRVADFLGVNARWLATGEEGDDLTSADLARLIQSLPPEKQEAVRRLIEALNR